MFRWAKQSSKERDLPADSRELQAENRELQAATRSRAAEAPAGSPGERLPDHASLARAESTPKPVLLTAEAADEMLPSHFPLTREARYLLPRSGLPLRSASQAAVAASAATAVGEMDEAEAEASRTVLYREPGPREKAAAVDQYAQYAARSPFGAGGPETADGEPGADGTGYTAGLPVYAEAPAWLSGVAEANGEPQEADRSVAALAVAETLQGSRERMASRWFALKGLFASEPAGTPLPQSAVPGPQEVRVPLLAVVSMAGGVGKTSLVATLGRALSAVGERVLLADLTTHGLLPFYFAASDLRPSLIRTFSPPAGSASAPVDLVSLDVLNRAEAGAEEWLEAELAALSADAVRVLFDVAPGTPWVLRSLARLNARIVVPVAPDMNSLITLGTLEKFFGELLDGAGRAVQPVYLLNGFDAAQALHLDVREVLHQQLGDRLLPFIVRHSPAVPEALAEGMTVVDYAPKLPITADYMNLAKWVRAQSSAVPSNRPIRWSERWF